MEDVLEGVPRLAGEVVAVGADPVHVPVARVERRGDAVVEVERHRAPHEPHVLGPDRGRASKERCLPEAGKIKSNGVVMLGKGLADRHPVQGVAAQPVDHQQRRISLSAEVEVVDRTIDVDDPMPQCVNSTVGNEGSTPPFDSRSR